MTALHDHQAVAQGQHGGTVRYDNDGQMSAQRLQRADQRGLRDGVEDHVGFIEGEHTRPVCQRANDVNLLSDRRRQVVTDSPAEHRFVSVRKQIDGCFQTQQLRHLAREIALFRAEYREILHDRAGKYHRRGSNVGNTGPYRQEVQLRGRDAANGDAARGRFDVPLNKLQQCGSTGTILAFDADDGSGLDRQIDNAQGEIGGGVIPECDFLEPDITDDVGTFRGSRLD